MLVGAKLGPDGRALRHARGARCRARRRRRGALRVHTTQMLGFVGLEGFGSWSLTTLYCFPQSLRHGVRQMRPGRAQLPPSHAAHSTDRKAAKAMM